MKKLDYIDALRGIAILGVIMVHTLQYGSSDVPNAIGKIIGMGSKGVQLFYLASAFTLFMSFSNRLSKENHPIKNFFIRRIFRIAPMYYIGIIYYLFQDGLGPRYWLGDQTRITAQNIMANATFVHGFNPYWINSLVPGGWSIGVEMSFYAVLPFLFSKIKNTNQAFVFFVVSIVLQLVLNIAFTRFPLIGFDRLWNEYLFFYFPSQLPIFALGILFYFLVDDNTSVRTISGKPALLLFGLVMGRIATGFEYLLPNHILFGMGFLVFAFVLSKYRFKLVVNPIINHIGKISFSMYLVQFAVFHWLVYFNAIDYFTNGSLNFMARFFVVVASTAALSTLFYAMIEVPMQNLGKALIARMEKKPVQIAVVS